MNLTKNFTLKEMQKTSTGLPNEAPVEAQINLRCLCCKVLQPLREKYGKPIIVNSGYRSEAVNKAVDGAPTSQHMKGQAADIRGTVGADSNPLRLPRLAGESNVSPNNEAVTANLSESRMCQNLGLSHLL